MTFDQFVARLQGIGVEFCSLTVMRSERPHELRYFLYRGRTSVVDLGDIRHPTHMMMLRVCRELQIDPAALFPTLN